MENAEKPIYPVLTQSPFLQNDTSLGLTKREYFAGLAMQGILANQSIVVGLKFKSGDAYKITKASIELADELLKQLENK